MLESKVQEAWRVLRIQSELVDGTEKLLKLDSAVTVFGGARLDEVTATIARQWSWASCWGRNAYRLSLAEAPALWKGLIEAASLPQLPL